MTIGTSIQNVESGHPSQISKGSFHYIDIAAVSRDTKMVEKLQVVPVGDAPSRARQFVKAGDVLVSTVRPNLNTVALLGPDHNGAVASTGFTVLRPQPEKLESRFLFHVVRSHSFVEEMVKRATGASYPAISDSDVRSFPLPKLSIAEQRRIADILDRADALKRKRQQALKLADDFLRATFLDMFGDLSRYPAVVLKDLAVEDGIKCGPFGTQLQKSEFRFEGVPLWGIKQLNKQFKKPTHEFVSHAKAKELSAYSIKSGDLVMTRKGDVGKCAIYPELLGDGVMHSDLVRLRLNKEFCDPYYLLFLLHHSSEFARSLDSISQGAVMAGVNVTKLKSLSIRNAPLERQLRFRKIVQETLAMKDRLQVIDLQVSELGRSITSSVFNTQEVTH